jgi:hypothetical protein
MDGPTSDLLSSVSSPELNAFVVEWRADLPVYPLPELAPGPRREWFLRWKEALDEEGITVTNCESLNWKDRYYLRTRAASAYVDANYGKAGLYTTFQACSTGGQDDFLLKKAFQLIPQTQPA